MGTARLGEVVARQVEQFGRLTERILAAAQLVGRPALDPEPMDLDAPAVGQWDRRRLGQVVSNLLGNAVKFGQGRSIEVTVSSRDDLVSLTVQDHGIGISADQLGELFQLYQRAVPVQNFGGLGLGLYLVRVIVEAHGGTVRAESNLGEGTTFTVELPQPAASSVPS